MIAALMLDLDDAPDFPGNSAVALGRPLAAYPWIAARGAIQIARRFVVTSSPPVKSAAVQYDAVIIDPPPQLPAGGLPALRALLVHGARAIETEVKSEGDPLEMLVVLLSNAATVTKDLIDKGIEALQTRPELDSAATVSAQNRFHPAFAQKENAGGILEPAAAPITDGTGDVFYPDFGAQILRPKHVNSEAADRPFPWLGKRVLPLKQWGGGPIDYSWQIPSLEYWLRKHGVSDAGGSMELQPKPQPQTKPRN